MKEKIKLVLAIAALCLLVLTGCSLGKEISKETEPVISVQDSTPVNTESDTHEDEPEAEPEVVPSDEQEALPESEPTEESSESSEEVEIHDPIASLQASAPQGTLLMLVNRPTEEQMALATESFDVTLTDQVLLIPMGDHTQIRIWSLVTEFDTQGNVVQQHDALLYENADAMEETVILTSIPRIDDTARYSVEVRSIQGEAEYYFDSYGDSLPDVEYVG